MSYGSYIPTLYFMAYCTYHLCRHTIHRGHLPFIIFKVTNSLIYNHYHLIIDLCHRSEVVAVVKIANYFDD
jgi:hypothetical protein